MYDTASRNPTNRLPACGSVKCRSSGRRVVALSFVSLALFSAVGMRRALCPTATCGRPLLFWKSSKAVVCRACKKTVANPNDGDDLTPQEEMRWLQWKASIFEKSGGLGPGRIRLVNRMADGISNYEHITAMWNCFALYGVDWPNGKVKKLSAMGRIEPFNLPKLGDWAFGIRLEHLDVPWYGRDNDAAEQLFAMIRAVGYENGTPGDRNLLVPLTVPDQAPLWNVASALSRASVGREAFGRLIHVEMVQQLRKEIVAYKKRCKYGDAVWSRVQRLVPLQPIDSSIPRDLELAAAANVMGRAILLLNDREPYLANVFVPFLWPPDRLLTPKRIQPSPVLVAHCSDRSIVPLVSTAERTIRPVYLPRQWFRTVWGAQGAEETKSLLTRYVDFDDRGRCLVANGKYFKPKFLRFIVDAFEKYGLEKIGAHPRLLAEFAEDNSTQLTELLAQQVNSMCAGKELLICVRCERLMRTMTVTAICPACRTGRHTRQQNADGSVQYIDGDHTSTPAPNSWCFTKRKHFYNGVEYDNPPTRLTIEFPLGGEVAHVSVAWFSGEAPSAESSAMRKTVGFLLKEYSSRGATAEMLEEALRTQIQQKINAESILEQKRAHLRESLCGAPIECLLDEGGFVRNEDLNFDAILKAANEACAEYSGRRLELREAMKSGSTPELQRQLLELFSTWSMCDDNVFSLLTAATKGADQEKLCRMVCSKGDLFRKGGLYYHYAGRVNGRSDHFRLPLLGEARFAFHDEDDVLVACVPSGHFPVDEAIDVICAVSEGTANGVWNCDHLYKDRDSAHVHT